MSAGATEARALPYATTSYETDEDGTLYAVLPTRCVYATGEQTCTIFVDHYRERKTGPCYPVAVVGCRRHEGGRRYTLYPPGHYPYGRVAVVPYSAGGELQLDTDGRPQWQATLFGAAQDAAQGRIWADEQHWWQSLAGGLRRTQGRHLETAGRLTGVSGELDAREREQIATRLGVATMTVLAEARRWRRGWKSRGAIWLAWSPPMELIPFSEDPLGNLGMFLIPSLILGTYLAASTMRMTRTMMLEVLRQDYIRTAWAKGLLERSVILRHAVKNAIIPVVTLVGMQLPILVGGSVIIENIFNLPGLGRLMLDALNDRDYPVVSAVNLFFATVVVVVNLVTDLLYASLDPRIRYE